MEQTQRLNILVERLSAENRRWRLEGTARSEAEQRNVLRALMNVRPPLPLDEETLRLQDEYLARRAEERGAVSPEEIPARDGVSLWQGDITRLAVDAIVNAANSEMLGCFQPLHSCIDNCIHTYAGMELRLECARQMAALREKYGPEYRQPTAVPMLTPGYNLPAKHVIHIVGPIVADEPTAEDRAALAACYENTLELCRENGLRTLALCCISTGVFHYPKEQAASLAVDRVRAWLGAHPGAMDRVIFAVHNDRDRALYASLLRL